MTVFELPALVRRDPSLIGGLTPGELEWVTGYAGDCGDRALLAVAENEARRRAGLSRERAA